VLVVVALGALGLERHWLTAPEKRPPRRSGGGSFEMMDFLFPVVIVAFSAPTLVYVVGCEKSLR
jgi:hypothetical protein